MRDLGAWHKDEALYAADNKKGTAILPGFCAKPAAHPPTARDLVSWDAFRKFVRKLHTKLCSVRQLFRVFLLSANLSQVLTACITKSASEFMHVSNAILVLREILPVFPVGSIHASTGQFLDDALQELLANESRGDIKVLAISYQGQLRMAKSGWEVQPPTEPTSSVSKNTVVSAGLLFSRNTPLSKYDWQSSSSGKTNGHTPVNQATAAKITSTQNAPPTAPSATRALPRNTNLIPPTNHPLPANPARSQPRGEGANEPKPLVPIFA